MCPVYRGHEITLIELVILQTPIQLIHSTYSTHRISPNKSWALSLKTRSSSPRHWIYGSPRTNGFRINRKSLRASVTMRT